MAWKKNNLRDLAAVGIVAASIGCGSIDESAKTTPIGEIESPRDPMAVSRPNQPPVIDSLQVLPARPARGGTVTARVQASDADRDSVKLSYEWRLGGKRVGKDSSTLHLSDAPKGTSIEVTVTPRDATSHGKSRSARSRVGNQPPILLGVVIEPLGEVQTHQDVSASPRASDRDGDEIEYRYRWRVNGEEVGDEGPILASRYFERGDQIELTATATDGQDFSAPLASEPFPVVNAPPAIVSTPGGIGDDGVFRYAVRAEDPDNDRMFRFRLLEAPAGMKIDVVTGELSWSPSDDQVGEHPVTIEVGDRNGGVGIQSFAVRIAFEGDAAAAAPAP
ncbi:MAG: putative Ig domain-containing protein [Myxococcota bacterium]